MCTRHVCTYVDQGINSTMTHVQHTRRVTRVQHMKPDSRAVSPLLCSTQILLACSAQNIAHVWPVACHMRVTRQKLKNTRVFSAHECQLRNELYCMLIVFALYNTQPYPLVTQESLAYSVRPCRFNRTFKRCSLQHTKS